MKLTDPDNSYARKILERGKPIKQLNKLAAKDDVNSGPLGEVSILISSLKDNDFNYLVKPINELIKKCDKQIAKIIIRRIPEGKIEKFVKSIRERFAEVIEAIPKNQSDLFLKVATKEIPANNGQNAAQIIRFMSANDKFDSLNSSITHAIQNGDGHYLAAIIAAIPAEKIPNFTEAIAEAILRYGDENIIRAIPTEHLNLFVEPIGTRIINLSPLNLERGVSTEALSFIKAIATNQIYRFIEPIGITIAKITNEASTKPIGLARICHKYIDAILKHVPDEFRETVVNTANDNIGSSAERQRLIISIVVQPRLWTERVNQKTLDRPSEFSLS